MCERTGFSPKAPRTKTCPFLDCIARVTKGDATSALATRAPCAERPPRLVAAVATSTVALARSFSTSGRCVASDMIVMPPMECPASTASCTSVASRTAVRSCASVSIVSGAVPLVLAPWPRWS